VVHSSFSEIGVVLKSINRTVKKIPKAVPAGCEWGHDDYSLRVENLPKAPPKPGQLSLFGDQVD
jgi:adenine-specific DNA-methyltransferase